MANHMKGPFHISPTQWFYANDEIVDIVTEHREKDVYITVRIRWEKLLLVGKEVGALKEQKGERGE